MKPSPHDVLTALRRLDPAGYERTTGRSTTAAASAVRRPAMAACRAIGWSYPAIGKAFHRDNSTVRHAVASFQRNITLGGIPGEAVLFRALILEASRVAMMRRDMGARQARGAA